MTPPVRVELPMEEAPLGMRLHAMAPDPGTSTARRVHRLLELRKRQELELAAANGVIECLGAIGKAVEPLPQLVGQRLDEIAEQVAEMALAVAGEILDEALECGQVDPTKVVRHCLLDAVRGADPADLTVYLAPDDLGPVLEKLHGERSLQSQLAAVRFEEDPALGRGAVRAETGAGRLVYEPREVFQRLCQAVREELQR